MNSRYNKYKKSSKKKNTSEKSQSQLSREQFNELMIIQERLENEKKIIEKTEEIMDLNEEITNDMIIFRDQMILDLNSDDSENSDDFREYDISDIESDELTVTQTNNIINDHKLFYNIIMGISNEKYKKPIFNVDNEVNKNFRCSLIQMIDLRFMNENDRENFKKCIELDNNQQCNVQKRKKENKVPGNTKDERYKNGWNNILHKVSILEDKINEVLKLSKGDLSNFSEVTLESIKICIEKKKLCKRLYDEVSCFF